MKAAGEQFSEQQAERANVLTQVRNQIVTEGFKGLILINAGGATALGAFVQAVWDKPTAVTLLPGILRGIAFLLVGTAVAAGGFVARHLSFFHPKTAQPFKNPWWWIELSVVSTAIALFVAGMGTAVYSAYHALPPSHEQSGELPSGTLPLTRSLNQSDSDTSDRPYLAPPCKGGAKTCKP